MRELKVAVSRLKVGSAEKNTSNFLNPSRLSAYENIGERREKQENHAQRGGKDQGGENARREAEVRWFDDGEKGSEHPRVRGGEGASGPEYRTLNWRE